MTRLVPCKNSPSVPGKGCCGGGVRPDPLRSPRRALSPLRPVVTAIAFRRDLSDIRHPAEREAALSESVRGDIRRIRDYSPALRRAGLVRLVRPLARDTDIAAPRPAPEHHRGVPARHRVRGTDALTLAFDSPAGR